MVGLSKLKSNKGYIFTFEAIVAVMAVLLIFYVGYFTITYNILTFHEEKRDIEAFEKSNLIADKIFKDYEFPSDSYVPDYLRFVDRVREMYYTSRETIPGTFDPYSNATYYFSNVIYYFRNVPNIKSNVNITDMSIPTQIQNFGNIYVKTKNLLVPVEMWKYNSSTDISENISIGEVLYFGTNVSSKLEYINISAPESVNVTISVNGVPFEMEVDSTPRISGFGKVINTYSYQPNEIKILNISRDVNITLDIRYTQPSTIYVLVLRPANISCIIPLRN